MCARGRSNQPRSAPATPSTGSQPGQRLRQVQIVQSRDVVPLARERDGERIEGDTEADGDDGAEQVANGQPLGSAPRVGRIARSVA